MLRKKNNKPLQPRTNDDALKRARRNICWQAGLAVLTILLTIVIVFAMTAAWYTNIVQTSGLVFEVEPWGFEGEITVNEEPIQAAPGDEGVVTLTVANDTEDISAISVNVSKARMATEMQQRLYFYVDTAIQRNSETVERVYLSNQESYTYTVFADSTLTLTETIHNDAQLKWQWVYDVLGYYVLGQANSEGSAVSVYEYLRPIEYDYDEATTTFVTQTDAEGNTQTYLELKTVDGTTTVDEFLVDLSARDGYPGTIDPSQKNAAGYYPVSVDEEGYGVYAYLCNYSEIAMNTRLDTALGEAAASVGEPILDTEGNATGATVQPQRYEAQLTVSAQKRNEDFYQVSTLAGLESAIQSGAFDVVRLTSDITLPEEGGLTLEEGDRIMIDLNGHTITSQASVAVNAQPGSVLTMVNGELVGDGDGYGVLTCGAEVTLSDVEVSDVKYGVYLMDGNGSNDQDSKVRLVGSKISAGQNAILILGNGIQSEQTTQLMIEDCVITANEVGGIAISGNGTTTGSGKWGTDIQIINSSVDGYWAAIYHPQPDSTLTIYNSTITGYTAMAIKGGTVVISGEAGLVLDEETGEMSEGTAIFGTGEQQAAAFGNSGFADTGDAIYIETNYNYEIALEISGDCRLISSHGYALQVYEPNAEWVNVDVSGGTFSTELSAAHIASGCVQKEANGEFTVTKEAE